MRIWACLAVVIALLVACTPTAITSRPRGSTFNGQSALDRVAEQLALGPRIPGSQAHRATEEWILAKLQASGWETEVQEFDEQGLALRNLVGRAGPQEESQVYVLGAHYDTRPLADRDPEAPDQPVPGANDGASGVAVLLELARVLDPHAFEHPVWLVFFDGEDGGGLAGRDFILGSQHFADNLSFRPAAVVIVDMVGDADLQLYIELNSDLDLATSIWDTARSLGYESFVPVPKYSILDDHRPFVDLGIPAVDIIDFEYPYWHTSHDTLDKVSAASLEQVGRTLQAWLTARP